MLWVKLNAEAVELQYLLEASSRGWSKPKGFYLAREVLEVLQALSLYEAQLDKIMQM